MRDVVVVGRTKTDARAFAERLSDDDRPRVIAARPASLAGHQADHWIILHGVPTAIATMVERLALKNHATVTYR